MAFKWSFRADPPTTTETADQIAQEAAAFIQRFQDYAAVKDAEIVKTDESIAALQAARVTADSERAKARGFAQKLADIFTIA